VSNGLEFDKALTAMMTTLQGYLPQGSPAVPGPSVAVASLVERTVGIGNWRGAQTRGGIGPVDLRGGRIDAVVRFHVWAAQPSDAESAAQALSRRLLGDRGKLREIGFLRLALKDVTEPGPQLISGPDVWRDSAAFQVLYEYVFDSSDGEGLIARIPVAIDSDLNESTTISDEMARWDDQTADPLVVRGRSRVGRISVLDSAAGAPPTGPVLLLRTHDGAEGPPIDHASLADFLAAVEGEVPAQNHARFIFASWTSFLASLQADPQPIILGGDECTPRELEIATPINLADPFDRFEIRYQDPAFDHPAVAYLRIRGR